MSPEIIGMYHALIKRWIHLLSFTHLHLIHVLITIDIISHMIHRWWTDSGPMIHIHLRSLIMIIYISIWLHIPLRPLTIVLFSKFYIVLPFINFLVIVEYKCVLSIILLLVFAATWQYVLASLDLNSHCFVKCLKKILIIN